MADSDATTNAAAATSLAAPPPSPPQLRRDEHRRVDQTSLADCIQWFLTYDPRVAAIRHTAVDQLFQWHQHQSIGQTEEVRAVAAEASDAFAYTFSSAEDRLAIGIAQALAVHTDEHSLHTWISQLLTALEEASKTNEEIASAYGLQMRSEASIIEEAAKLPTELVRTIFLTSCWLETLCTAETRVLGWTYQSLYGRAFHPDNF